jgi:large conductance mechanosensitive channel
MLKEFKEFISRGSVIDLAVGIIIGAAFTAIVNSLVNDVIMPPIGLLLGGVDFSDFFITLKGTSQATLKATQASGAVVIAYGQFINAVIKFLIVAAAVFILIKQVNLFLRKKPPEPAAPPPPAPEVELLTQIRDLLKSRG